MNYRLKHLDLALNSKILVQTLNGLSNRRISRLLFISEHCVRIRVERLARQALDFHEWQLRSIFIGEPVCFDGLENFAGSQYDPNNLQQAIGRNSLFIYDFNFASLNRKGRMSVWQKRRLQQITQKYGRYNPKNIRIATKDLFERLYIKNLGWSTSEPLTILSDEHFQYRRVLKQDLPHLNIKHLTVSSKACRNYQNILFSVNHADLVIRQSLASFARETISFSKTAGRMCQRYALFMIYKNYMSPQFTKAQVRRPDAHLKSPAEHLGVTNRLMTFEDIFRYRSREENIRHWPEDWQCFWHARVPEKYLRSPTFSQTHFPAHSLMFKDQK